MKSYMSELRSELAPDISNELTIVSITLNEEEMLPTFLENIKRLSSNILVVDSFSTDETKSICLNNNVNFVENKFEGFGSQWNFAISNELVKTKWVMKLDPDERLTDELVQSIRNFITDDEEYNGASFDRVLFFNNQNTKVKQQVVRIWKKGYCRFSDVSVNEHPIILGRIKRLKGVALHLDNSSINDWFAKQLHYSDLEAISFKEKSSLSFEPRLLGSSDERRMFFKRLFFKVPLKYLIYRTYLIIANFNCVLNRPFYDWIDSRIIVLKMIELKLRDND